MPTAGKRGLPHPDGDDPVVSRVGEDLRHAIDTLVLSDQAERLTILEEAVLRNRTPDDCEAQH